VNLLKHKVELITDYEANMKDPLQNSAQVNATFEKDRVKLRETTKVNHIIESICTNIDDEAKMKVVAASTVLDWWQELLRSGFKGFKEDMRGHYKHDLWIERWGLTERFTLWMSTTKDVDVNMAMDWLNAQPAKLLPQMIRLGFGYFYLNQ
jgi:hypothetical protein